MVAVDQREAMRAMFAEYDGEPVPDARLTEFKLAATRALTPYASAILVDRDFALDRVIDERAVAPGCALIAAADRFLPGPGEFVADVEIDDAVDPAAYARRGVAALKLLVIWRPDEPAEGRVAMVREFVQRSHAAGLVSIIEPLSRAPRDGRDWDWDAGVLAAAEELGSLGADLYKAEVPLHGEGDETELKRRCEHITGAVASPWVVLSSGVQHEAFPRAVELACLAGASGFLAGRAVWRPVVGSRDVETDLRADSVPRLRELVRVVDRIVGSRRKDEHR
ncbi:MAG: aldolase [Actinophytocola sp.]|nr:aldolase [Actinophytocola sp.]